MSMNDVKDNLAMSFFGRVRKVGECVCCGVLVDPEKDFRDARSRKEYTISYFCQSCQDKLFRE